MLPPTVKHLLLSLIGLCLWCPAILLGEGSVNFINYPGHRLFYNTSVDQQLKVYAAAGEFINVGASHVGMRGGFIQVFRPDGTFHSSFDGTNGTAIIHNHIEEINGPNGGGTTQGEGYIPGVISVTGDQAGIWTIILDYPEHNFDSFQNILNNAPWTRENDQPDNRRVILAWDITVTQSGAGNEGGSYQSGRVYSNEYISMINRNGTTTSPVFYVLSKDGFQYRLNFNQTDPFGFPLSANNMGVVTGNQKPTYQSARQADITTSTDIANWQANERYLYPPQAPDQATFITHKLFFNPPDASMPSSALVTEIFSTTTHTTWLYTAPRPITFNIQEIGGSIEIQQPSNPIEIGTQYLVYESSHEGILQVKIDINRNGLFSEEVDIQLSQFITAGKDSIVWEGLDGLGNPIGIDRDTTWQVQTTFQAGEIHIFNQDIENDLGGLTITRINGNNAPKTEFYFDHSPVGGTVSGNGSPNNAQATDQPFTYESNFGNEILFDYWAFAILEKRATTASFMVQPVYDIDRDNDGILDNEDQDDDNDGLSDIKELCALQIACPFLTFNPNGDEDGDGIENFLDADDPSIQLNCLLDSMGICQQFPTWMDVDKDQIPNFLDTDSDNDNLLDSLETNVDTDDDNLPNFLDTDSDNDGLLDSLESAEDADMDSIPNYLDNDSDNDGLLDSIEGSEDIDRDSIPNYLDNDSDNDGLLDNLEGSEDADLDSIPNYLDTDSDNDGIPDNLEGDQDFDLDTIPNYLDNDSDNDGIPDELEGSEDTDQDGIPNYLDSDSDNDGIPDEIETEKDTDGDGIPDFLDSDSDNDAIPDALEKNIDTDSDGTPDYLDLDSDNDGINDVKEMGVLDANGDGQADGEDFNKDGLMDNPPALQDSDNDGIPNHLDLDSDNDGVLDIVENGDAQADLNGDGMADGIDEDGDGILSSLDDNEEVFGENNDTPIQNTDGTDEPDFLDTDRNNDGITDIAENGNGDLDQDQDGMVDEPIADNDKDGIPSPLDQNPTVFGNFNDSDIDADGIENIIDLDDDNDGIVDSLELCVNLADCPFAQIDPAGDEDGDGIVNWQDAADTNFRSFCVDTDADGICDYPPLAYDSDQDEVPNHLDLDSDNDGISDVTEAGFLVLDADGNGRIDGHPADFGENGVYTNLPTDTIADSDQDGIYNFIDIDGDNDGIFDIQEGQYFQFDADHNGRFDNTSRAISVNKDGIGDVLEGGSFQVPLDSDRDRIYNAIDLDSDNDGIGDVLEGGAALVVASSGIGDILEGGNIDADQDGFIGTTALVVNDFGQPISDALGIPLTPYYLPADTDQDGVFNFRDLDSDNDGIGDVLEGGNLDLNRDGFIGTTSLITNELGQPIGDDSNFIFTLNLPPIDNDGDGIANLIDSDSDNDGIGDVIEGGSTSRSTTDGIGDVLEGGSNLSLDFNNNGFLGGEEVTTNDLGQPIQSMSFILPINSIPVDTDVDGIPDLSDLDSDDDGMNDVLEAGGMDTDGNGQQDGTLQPSGSKGTFLVVNDLDLDSIPDFLDLDVDGDGIFDVVENGGQASDLNGDGKIDGDDTDGDGIKDIEDGLPNEFGDANDKGLLDTDGDGIPDILDADSDNDGISNEEEIAIALNDGDSDGDGVPDFLDLDSDNDGINDVHEIGGTDTDGDGQADGEDDNQDGIIDDVPTLKDSDGDGIPNHLDLDSDNDGVLDIIENGDSQSDENGDGMADGEDQDGDGIPDSLDDNDTLFGEDNDLPPTNSDGTDEPDITDTDSDNDGITDIEENGNGDLDQDGDGMADPPLIDEDQDGIISSLDGNDFVFGNLDEQDKDADGIVDSIDRDDDNDSILDQIEICKNDPLCPLVNFDPSGDEDQDGIPNYLDANEVNFRLGCTDTDADGICDVLPRWIDSDEDNIPNHFDLDADNDGYSDISENGQIALDENLNGRLDKDSAATFVTLDSDQDGVFNFLDIDSDNDGIYDIQEDSLRLFDTDNNGRIDNTSRSPQVDENGVPNILNHRFPSPLDTDSDLFYNAIDLDADNDGIGDVLEGGNTNFNKIGFAGNDLISVNDFGEIITSLEGSAFDYKLPNDKDEDSVPNFLDADSDNDGIGDVLEGGNTDADKNGFIGEGELLLNKYGQVLMDAVSTNYQPNQTELDTDEDGVANYLDLDSDNDGIGDVLEGGNTDLDKNGFLGTSPLTINQFGQVIADAGSVLYELNLTPPTHDNDAVYSFVDLDADNDGIGDVIEGGNEDPDKNGFLGTSPLVINFWGQVIGDTMGVTYTPNKTPIDSESDSYYNFIDTDSDNDGIGDVLEGGNTDFDKNGYIGTDPLLYDALGVPLSDNNGVLFSAFEKPLDFDGDAAYDYLDLDADDDGINDILEGGGIDLNGDAFQDGIVSERGIVGILLDPADTDFDGQPDFLDIDSDSDGIADLLENGCGIFDENGDGLVDGTDTELDGIKDLVDGLITVFGDEDDKGLLFSDEDSLANFIDLDSDDDGIWDIAENGWETFDQNNDGILDFLADLTNDGIGDTIPLPYALLDVDGDSIPNILDTDSDNDQISDLLECPTPENCPDFDQDGIPDFLDVDCNQLSIPSIQLLASDTIICAGGTAMLTAINTQPSAFAVSYTWSGTDKILISESDSQADTFSIALSAVDANSEGYYRFTIQSQQGECAAKSDSIFIEVIEKIELQPTLEIEQDTICRGSKVALQAMVSNSKNIQSYNWYRFENNTRTLIENTKIPTLTIENFTAEMPVNFQVEAISNQCGSQLSNTATLFMYGQSEATIRVESSASLATPLCVGSTLELSPELFGNVAYQWITPNGDTLSERVLNLSPLTEADAGRYQVFVNIANCFTIASEPIEVQVQSIPSPIIAPTPPSCVGASVRLDIQNPSPNFQYDWFNENDLFIARTNEPFIQLSDNLQAQEAIGYYAIAFDNNCFSSPSTIVPIEVIEPTIAAAIAGTNQVLCNENTAILNATPPTEGTGTWQTAAGTFVSNSPTPTVPLTIGTNTFIWTIQHPQCAITESDTVQIENTALPAFTAFAGTDQTVCLEKSISLNTQNLPIGITGNWQTLNGSIIIQSNSANPIISNLQEGMTQLVWTLSTNECPAFSTDTLNVHRILPPNEIAQAGSDQSICLENNIDLAASPPIQSFGRWTSLNGNNFENANSPFTNVNNLQPGSNQIVWSLSTEQCRNFSSDTLTIQKTTPPNEVALAGIDQEICMEESVQLNANTPTLSKGVWKTNESLTFENSSDAQTIVSNLQEGSNQLIWTLSFENCLNYDRDTLEIFKQSPPEESANAGMDIRLCEASTLQLNAQQGTQSKGEWLTMENLAIDNAQQATATITNLIAGEDYQLIWSLSTDLCSNFSQDTLNIIIDAFPNDIATIKRDEFESTPSPTQPQMDVVFCDPNSILLEAILPENMVGQWQTANQVALEPLSDGRVLISSIQENQLQFIWSLSQHSCIDYSSDTIDIEILRADGLAANTDEVALFFNESISEIDLLANDEIPAEMAWTFTILEEGEGSITDVGEGFINYTPRQNFFGEDVFIYQLCHADCPELCDTTQIKFQVKGINSDQSCFVPNIITPNGDGINDVFTVPCLSEYPDHELSIFNRWGDEVFRASPYKNNWEGTHKFSPLPPGTYFYVLALTDDPLEQLSGYFTIVR